MAADIPVPPRSLCRHRDNCRLCGSRDLLKVFELTPTPPANAFVPRDRLQVLQPVFPLDLWFCHSCTHLQLLDVVDPEYLFRDYVYVSGTSPTFVAHFEAYAQAMQRRLGLRAGDLVIDIGSNDGTLLRFFQQNGQLILGIDPAEDIARRANESGVETWAKFMTPELGAQIVAERGPARLVTANNVFAHVDDLASVVRSVRSLLARDGLFVFEVSYLLDVFEKTLFDTIYHEHLDYHAVFPLIAFFRANGMELMAAERIGSHGGSLRGMAQHIGGPYRVEQSVQALCDAELAAGLRAPEAYSAYARRIAEVGGRLRDLLDRCRRENKRVAGFGAPAKATTLMYHFGLGPDTLDYIIDDSPLKQGLYTPGLHVPVLPATILNENRPDYLLILAWNFADAIIGKLSDFSRTGGRFIVPLPTIEVR